MQPYEYKNMYVREKSVHTNTHTSVKKYLTCLDLAANFGLLSKSTIEYDLTYNKIHAAPSGHKRVN